MVYSTFQCRVTLPVPVRYVCIEPWLCGTNSTKNIWTLVHCNIIFPYIIGDKTGSGESTCPEYSEYLFYHQIVKGKITKILW